METVFKNFFKIHGKEYKKLMQDAVFDEEARINPQTTLMLLHCQNFPELGCKTLLLDQYRGIIKTNKETRKLINIFVAEHPLSFWGMRIFNICKDRRKGALPYVFGNTILVPLGGTTQHSTHWVMFNRVLNSSFDEQSRSLHLWFKMMGDQHVKIELKVKRAVVRQHIEHALYAHIVEMHFLEELTRELNSSEVEGQLHHLVKKKAAQVEYIPLKKYSVALKQEVVAATLKEVYDEEPSPELLKEHLKVLHKKWEKL
ncbi:hypothetical protein [Liquorilactobacillus oeni]|uniref:Uncharacterized protein n=1 Tax=Liquorilactobacillus oeni DSM 19972 TaxID=1423777 RepID=A0A0R1M8R6_9LACO|nr:hypothetical protein [Liquorilactobacillus oeni]KRL04543.1 hypothetical protein FD46_GL001674 [Liquorilactobacillus oeni DSM 19972]